MAELSDLILQYQALISQQQAALNAIAVQTVVGGGPVALTAEQSGRRILIGNGSNTATIIVNLPASATVGTILLPRQAGSGPLKFVPASGATLINRAAHNGTAGKWAGVSLTVEANSNGTSAVWVLEGDTAAIA